VAITVMPRGLIAATAVAIAAAATVRLVSGTSVGRPGLGEVEAGLAQLGIFPRELHEALQAARIQQSLRERAAGVDDRRLVGEALGVIAAAAPAAEPPAATGTAPAAPATEPAGESPIYLPSPFDAVTSSVRTAGPATPPLYPARRARCQLPDRGPVVEAPGMRGIRPPWSDAAPQARAVPGGASASADSR